MHGYRLEMEDYHSIAMPWSQQPDTGYFAVYDGHSGAAAAQFTAAHLPAALEAVVAQQPAILTSPALQPKVVEAIMQLDTQLLQEEAKAGKELGGCTAVFAAISRKNASEFTVSVGNIGDSRCIHGRAKGGCRRLLHDHGPELPAEAARIRHAGGTVEMNRVDGALAMSRALGDTKYKKGKGLSPTEQKVIPVPDLLTVEVQQGDFIIMACDGLFEAMTDEAVAACVAAELQKKPDPAAAASALCSLSLERGSKDNMSAIVVLVGVDGREYHQEKGDFRAGEWHDGCGEQFMFAYMQDAQKHGFDTQSARELYARQNPT